MDRPIPAASPAPPAGVSAEQCRAFGHVECWIFDLDNTLYPPASGLFPQIERRMTGYVQRLLGVDAAEADRLRAHYWRENGTTLAGLMSEHGIDPVSYLDDVHAIDLSALRPDRALGAAIAALPGQKIIHTNADAAYAKRVLDQCQLTVFDAIYGIGEVGFHPKPDPRSFAAVAAAHGFDPARSAMFEDDPRNLVVPFSQGMQTVLVGAGRHGPDELDMDHTHGDHVLWRTQDLTGFVATLAATLSAVAR